MRLRTMNCKPGDQAMCVAGEFAGAVCEVVAMGATYSHIASGAPLPGWLVEFPREMPWSNPSPIDLGRHEGWYPDAWLRPIRGEPQTITCDEALTV